MTGARQKLKTLTQAVRRDRGAALVTVMLLVSVMAAGAVVTFDALGYTVKRATARTIFGQARLYALGGEQLALSAAEKVRKANARLSAPKAVSYPIDGGQIDGLLTDASNCFNVNSLVSMGDSGSYRLNEIGAAQYLRLLKYLGLNDREALALTNTLTDWIDSDSRPLAMGAEDYDYGALETPYRAANTMIADLSELRLVAGYEAETRALVMPFLCAGENTAQTTLNVNTLKVSDAPLLAAILGGDLPLSAAVDVIAARPARGYSDIADFYFERALNGRTIDQAARAQTSVKPSRFVSQIRVRFHEGVSRLTSEIKMDDDGAAHIVRHQFGVFQ